MRLVPSPGKIIKGQIYFKGGGSFTKSEKEMQKIRGNKIAMIFQDPMTSLNPVYTIGDQLIEPLRLHKNLDKKLHAGRLLSCSGEVRIPDPEKRLNQYPHEFSGGMRQRGYDSNGARLSAGADYCRRAHNRPGCYDTSSDTGAHERTQGKV